MDYKRNIRMWSLLGQRGTLGMVLNEFAKEDERIYALTADLCKTSGLSTFAKNYPERFLNIGIAEQNLIGVAAGIADEGKIPFVTTFANFATLRANEFVRHFMSYMKCNVKLVGLGAGFAMELFGNTHYGVEDISVIRSMPNITILSPADCVEVVKCVEFSIEHQGAVYLRLTGKMNHPIVYKNDYEFEVGKGIVLEEGKDIVLYATGSMVSCALQTATLLNREGISVKVINIHTVKPIDEELILQNKNYALIVTLEEHSKIGGLGSAVDEVLIRCNTHGKVLNLGIEQGFKKAGDYEYMLKQNRLTPELIKEDIKAFFEE